MLAAANNSSVIAIKVFYTCTVNNHKVKDVNISNMGESLAVSWRTLEQDTSFSGK